MTTRADIELATVFYPLLVELAIGREVDTYKGILDKARQRHPDNAYVQRGHPRNVARRLNIIRAFTDRMEYPVLAALIVNGTTGLPGVAFKGDFESLREEAFAFDWSTAEADFTAEVETLKQALGANPTPAAARRDRKTSLELISAHYQQHKSEYHPHVIASREELVTLLMRGEDVDDAFEVAAAPYRKSP